jgi:DNA-binding NarL/FixJ family response regulator
MERPLRVVIADDHGLVRRGTREILEQDGSVEVIGEAGNGVEAVDLVAELQPDVALLDIGMPEMNGVDATRVIKTRWPAVAVVVLTIHDDDEYVLQAIQAGASGYLLKDVADDDLIQAVHTVRGGGAVLDPAVTEVVIGRVRLSSPPEAETEDERLTARELEVLQLAGAGYSNRRIGVALSVSPRTVEVHMHRIFQKLDVTSRTEAVVLAARRGLIDIGADW